jgi:adenylate kinase
MIVEILGMPGSGKSTLNQLLIEKLKSKNYSVITFEIALKQYFQNSRYFFSILNMLPKHYHSLIFRNIYNLWFGRKIQQEYLQLCSPDIKRKIQYLINEIKIKYPSESKKRIRWFETKIRQYSLFQKIMKDQNCIAFADHGEGISSSIGSLFINDTHDIDQIQIKSFLFNWPLPDIIVLVDAETNSCMMRLKKRGLPDLLKKKSNSTIISSLENQLKLDKMIISEAYRQGISVYFIKNDYNSVEKLQFSIEFKHIVNVIISNISFNQNS